MSSSDIATANSTGLKPEDVEFLDALIARILQAPMKKSDTKNNNSEHTAEMDVQVGHEEVQRVCIMAVEAFKKQPALVRVQKNQLPITICGDIHGQLRDLRLIVDQFGTMDKHNYLFMGDFADRGTQGIEAAIFLLANHVRYPKNVVMLRGNHEDLNTSMIYGLLDECVQKYGSLFGPRTWLQLVNVYNYLPFSAIVADKIFCTHGGISPHLRSLDDINRIPRPTIIPFYGLACDLVWSDPSKNQEGWALSPRGISFTFDEKLAGRFCKHYKLDLILRGHQISNEMHGNGFSFSGNKRILTLFTASDYLRSQNTGAVLTVDPSLQLSFTLFRPMTKKRMRRAACLQKSKTLQNSSSSKGSTSTLITTPNLDNCCE